MRKLQKKKLIIKAKYTVNVVNQPHIKLAGRLKDKTSKMYTATISSYGFTKQKCIKYDIETAIMGRE